MERLLGFAPDLHHEFSVRKLEQSMHLKTRCPAQQIFGGNPAGMNIARRGKRKQRGRDWFLELTFCSRLKRKEVLEDSEVAVAQVRSAICYAGFSFERSGRVEQAVGVNQEITLVLARHQRVQCLQHLELERISKQSIENLQTNAGSARRGAPDEARNGAKPLEDFDFESRSRRTRECRTEVLLDRHERGAMMSAPNF